MAIQPIGINHKAANLAICTIISNRFAHHIFSWVSTMESDKMGNCGCGPFKIHKKKVIDDFRGACAVKGNVQVAGRTWSVSTTEMLSTHDVTLRNVDGSLFHVQIWFVMGHQDQNGQNWRNISQFTMWLSQSSVNVFQTYQSLYQFQHFASKRDSAMDKWCLPQ